MRSSGCSGASAISVRRTHSFLSTFKRRKKAGAIPVRTVRLSPIFKLTSNNVSKGKEILTVGFIVDFYWFLELSHIRLFTFRMKADLVTAYLKLYASAS